MLPHSTEFYDRYVSMRRMIIGWQPCKIVFLTLVISLRGIPYQYPSCAIHFTACAIEGSEAAYKYEFDGFLDFTAEVCLLSF